MIISQTIVLPRLQMNIDIWCIEIEWQKPSYDGIDGIEQSPSVYDKMCAYTSMRLFYVSLSAFTHHWSTYDCRSNATDIVLSTFIDFCRQIKCRIENEYTIKIRWWFGLFLLVIIFVFHQFNHKYKEEKKKKTNQQLFAKDIDWEIKSRCTSKYIELIKCYLRFAQ